ncbi:expressed unknown protein [Seminavis robusta]|uniref:Uncharacterized protein n=1 Tax=Seminavis robusta TaxID=568900 RepID=A0A9N8HM28_9STRA|nr:expressed unknown protein [Seminavis robusta]|eukprot:Sro873_g214001.1  (259) ;mRNA; r:9555-10331
MGPKKVSARPLAWACVSCTGGLEASSWPTTKGKRKTFCFSYSAILLFLQATLRIESIEPAMIVGGEPEVVLQFNPRQAQPISGETVPLALRSHILPNTWKRFCDHAAEIAQEERRKSYTRAFLSGFFFIMLFTGISFLIVPFVSGLDTNDQETKYYLAIGGGIIVIAWCLMSIPCHRPDLLERRMKRLCQDLSQRVPTIAAHFRNIRREQVLGTEHRSNSYNSNRNTHYMIEIHCMDTIEDPFGDSVIVSAAVTVHQF